MWSEIHSVYTLFSFFQFLHSSASRHWTLREPQSHPPHPGEGSQSLSFCLTFGIPQHFSSSSSPPMHDALLPLCTTSGIKSHLLFSSPVPLFIHSHKQPCIRCLAFSPGVWHTWKHYSVLTFTSSFSYKSCTAHWESISCPKTVHKIADQKQT